MSEEAFDAGLSAGETAYMQSGGTDDGALAAELASAAAVSTKGADGTVPSAVPNAVPNGAEKGTLGTALGTALGTDSGQPKTVPVQALHEERTRRQALEAQNAEINTRYVRAEERLKVLNELLQPEATAAEKDKTELIDPEKDIFGAFKQLSERHKALEERLSSQAKKSEEQTEEQQTQRSYENDARRFMAATNDFVDAYKHLMSGRGKELEALGIADQTERLRIMVAEEKQIATAAIKSGRSPAEAIYNLAKIRGFTGKAASPSAAAPAAPAVNSDAQAKMASLEAGKAASLSLGGVGSSGNTQLTMESLADMDESEFARVVSKLSPADKRRFMGG